MTMVTHVAPKMRDVCHVTIGSLVEIQQNMQVIEDSTTGDVRVHVDKVSDVLLKTLSHNFEVPNRFDWGDTTDRFSWQQAFTHESSIFTLEGNPFSNL